MLTIRAQLMMQHMLIALELSIFQKKLERHRKQKYDKKYL